MISGVFIVVFIFCLGIAVASILISHQFMATYNTDFHKKYFYYLVSFYAFAIYGIWGQIVVRVLLSSLNTSVKVIETVANFLPILGVPFLFISWLMLVSMGYSLFNVKMKPIWGLLHVGFLLLLLGGSWIGYTFFSNDPEFVNAYLKYAEVGILIAAGFVYTLTFLITVMVLNNNNDLIGHRYVLKFAFLMVLAFILRSILLPFSFLNPWILALVILVYFGSNFIPLFYLRINSDNIFKPVKAENASEVKLEFIFKKYRITRREREIVNQICSGKSNQQIADELFISLQTVKDHTHRIYRKIGINSRMQLVQQVSA